MHPATTTDRPLLELDPVPILLAGIRAELAHQFGADRPLRISRAPGRLDVMGGIAEYTGSMVCQMPIDRGAAIAIQERTDRELQVFSFNFLDLNRPFTFRIPFDSLASNPVEMFRREFDQPGRKWAAYLAGCLLMLHQRGWVDLRDPRRLGLNVALYSTIPMGASLASSAAIEVAMMMALRDHFRLTFPAAGRCLRILGGALDASHSVFGPMELAQLCQTVENEIVGAPCGIVEHAACCLGEQDRLMWVICQPHQLQPSISIPPGMRWVGIYSGVQHEVRGSAYRRTRCAAFMGHRIILDRMRQMGQAAGRRMIADPTRGYLANLDADDYKRLFRTALPEKMSGRLFIEQFGSSADSASPIEPDIDYAIQRAVDHHVLEVRRVRNFAKYVQSIQTAPSRREKGGAMDRAGHLMYASHQSYSRDAMLGSPECDLLVQLVRQRERQGLYGARITGEGCGGTVAVLAEETSAARAAILEIIELYRAQTGRDAMLIGGSSAGAWHTGTQIVTDGDRPRP